MAADSELGARPRPLVAVAGAVREVGDLASFSGRAVSQLGGSWRYAAEALRQCSVLITGSALVIVAMQLVIGGECALFSSYFLKSFGASGAVGVFTELCGVREMFPYMFGYILA